MLFRKKDKKDKDSEETVRSETEEQNPTWNDGVPGASPKRSQYFDALRTRAYINHNAVANYVEFYVALQDNPDSDKWRVVHYLVYDLDQKDGIFESKVMSEGQSFPQALAALAATEFAMEKMGTHSDAAMATQYPPEKFPELKQYYYDIEHYRNPAYIEGYAISNVNDVYRRIEGKVFGNATFKRADIVDSIQAKENATDNLKVKAELEGGILSDIFYTASSRTASLDNILKVGQVLMDMDQFAQQVGALYLSVQAIVGVGDKFDKIEGFVSADEKSQAYKKALQSIDWSNRCQSVLNEAIPQMFSTLETAAEHGVHTEPFQKFTAECALYVNLLNASQKLSLLERSFTSAVDGDANLITEIRSSVDNAQKRFLSLGGTQEQMDRLKAWVANPNKDQIPKWLPGFLTRYYTARAKVMQKVQDRKATATDVRILPAEVKPPLNGDNKPGMNP